MYQVVVSSLEKIGSLVPWYSIILAPRFFSVARLLGLGGVMNDMAASV